jgi:sulfatase maturation enzyme AslB (radical SAM superfamily)
MNFSTYIGGDLNVYRCCTTAYNERGVIGSLKNQTFRQLWESQEKREDFDNFDARGCERCMFNNENRVISYLLEPDPLHVNFV